MRKAFCIWSREIAESMPTARAKSNEKIVSEAIKQYREKLENAKLKPTVGEFIRLLELQDQMKAQKIKEIIVTWVD